MRFTIGNDLSSEASTATLENSNHIKIRSNHMTINQLFKDNSMFTELFKKLENLDVDGNLKIYPISYVGNFRKHMRFRELPVDDFCKYFDFKIVEKGNDAPRGGASGTFYKINVFR